MLSLPRFSLLLTHLRVEVLLPLFAAILLFLQLLLQFVDTSLIGLLVLFSTLGLLQLFVSHLLQFLLEGGDLLCLLLDHQLLLVTLLLAPAHLILGRCELFLHRLLLTERALELLLVFIISLVP